MSAPITERLHVGQAALKQKAGWATAAGVTKDVMFAPASGELKDAIDAAYRAKYTSSPYLRPMIGDKARPATMHKASGDRTPATKRVPKIRRSIRSPLRTSAISGGLDWAVGRSVIR
jgi:hypothetical protein